jgi:hypothetical protein
MAAKAAIHGRQRAPRPVADSRLRRNDGTVGAHWTARVPARIGAIWRARTPAVQRSAHLPAASWRRRQERPCIHGRQRAPRPVADSGLRRNDGAFSAQLDRARPRAHLRRLAGEDARGPSKCASSSRVMAAKARTSLHPRPATRAMSIELVPPPRTPKAIRGLGAVLQGWIPGSCCARPGNVGREAPAGPRVAWTASVLARITPAREDARGPKAQSTSPPRIDGAVYRIRLALPADRHQRLVRLRQWEDMRAHLIERELARGDDLDRQLHGLP